MLKKNIIKKFCISAMLAAAGGLTLTGCAFGGDNSNTEASSENTSNIEETASDENSIDKSNYKEFTPEEIAEADAVTGVTFSFGENGYALMSDEDDNMFEYHDGKFFTDEEGVSVFKIKDTNKYFMMSDSAVMFRGDVTNANIIFKNSGKELAKADIKSLKNNDLTLVDNRGGFTLMGTDSSFDYVAYPYNMDFGKGYEITGNSNGEMNVYMTNNDNRAEFIGLTSGIETRDINSVNITDLETGKALIENSVGVSFTIDYVQKTAFAGSSMESSPGETEAPSEGTVIEVTEAAQE